MKLSAKSRYGLRLTFLLAHNYPAPMSATTLEKSVGVSSKYIEKIMRALTEKGIVRADRGINGGYYLTKKPEEIGVGCIVRALEDEMEFIACVSEGNSCCCPTKSVWKKMYDGINQALDSITLGDMLSSGGGECKACSCKEI